MAILFRKADKANTSAVGTAVARLGVLTEALKAADPMKWVGLMNCCKAQAEEIVKFELIYV